MAELDASELKKRKTEQVEMAKEACICLVSCERLFVIRLSNLKKQEVDVKDWTCLPPPDFDLVLELPDRKLSPFEFDSKMYMASSELPGIPGGEPVSMADLKPWPIYEFKFEEGDIVRAESLDDAPLPFHKSFIANTPDSCDVYFYINMKSRVQDSSGFYVLRSGSRIWKPLIAPPTTNSGPLVQDRMFVLDNNLFVLSNKDSCSNKDPCLARFDPIKESWMVEPASDNNLSNFIDGRMFFGDDDHCRITYHPQISVSLPGAGSSNYTVCLTNEYVEVPPHKTPLDRVLAILVNHQNGRVSLYQYLDVCFEGIQPNLGAKFNFVDLGNGKLCAILSGIFSGDLYCNIDLSALCISVFTLSVLKDFAALQLDSGAPPMERDFLQVTVHSKSAYTMENWRLVNWMCHAFVWPPTKGGRFQHRTTIL